MHRLLAAALLPLLFGACARSSLPDVASHPSPADARIADRAPTNAGVIAGYTHREPVSPRPWKQLNQEQAPNGGAGS
ncbi:hypothetical protein D1F64_21475 [Breoghania sp. L-A4]|nr:hypothetical protein D1F64_21475 [Breoghania sp. L-A4]